MNHETVIDWSLLVSCFPAGVSHSWLLGALTSGGFTVVVGSGDTLYSNRGNGWFATVRVMFEYRSYFLSILIKIFKNYWKLEFFFILNSALFICRFVLYIYIYMFEN